MRATFLGILAAPALVACGTIDLDGQRDEPVSDEKDRPRCTQPFAGDTDAGIAFEITSLDAYGGLGDVGDGARLPLVLPPQGGRVLYVGVNARNVDPCGVELSGALRDPATEAVRFDARTVNLVVGDGGVASSSRFTASAFSNIPVCPNQWAERDAYDSSFQLEVRLTDRLGRSATTTINVTPYCSEPELEAECRCICRQGYRLGDECN